MTGAARLVVLVCAASAGCSLFGTGASSSDGGGTTGTGGGAAGFGGPTLELTVNGTHVGPAGLSSGAADLTSSRDTTTGALVETTLHLSAASTAGAACDLSFQRFGDRVTPFHVGAFQAASPTSGGTGDGTVAASPGESVSAAGMGWQCAGSACDGAVLQLTALAADHVEGSFSGTLVDASGSSAASVVCAFWLPTRTFQP